MNFMKVIKYPSLGSWDDLLKRPVMDTRSLADTVSSIIEDVKQNGDAALRRYSRAYDKVELDDFLVNADEYLEAEVLVPQDLKDALSVAKANIERFHRIDDSECGVIETMPGVFCWKRHFR